MAPGSSCLNKKLVVRCPHNYMHHLLGFFFPVGCMTVFAARPMLLGAYLSDALQLERVKIHVEVCTLIRQ